MLLPLISKIKKNSDLRGSYTETYNYHKYIDMGIKVTFVQEGISYSKKAGTIRGLHFQNHPKAQDKLVRCNKGEIFDVVVDIRVGSPNYGKWLGYQLSEENGRQLFIPKGFAHGFCTLKPKTEIIYKFSDYYAPETEDVLLWNDPDIGVKWGIDTDVIISEKDEKGTLFKNFKSSFIWENKN